MRFACSVVRVETAARLSGVSPEYVRALQLVGILPRSEHPEWLPYAGFAELLRTLTPA